MANSTGDLNELFVQSWVSILTKKKLKDNLFDD